MSSAIAGGYAGGVYWAAGHIGLLVGMVSETAAFLMNVGTNEPAAFTGEEFTVEDPVVTFGADIGIATTGSAKFMPYVGGFYGISASDEGTDAYGASAGLLGYLGGMIVYQVGGKFDLSGTEQSGIDPFIALGLQMDM